MPTRNQICVAGVGNPDCGDDAAGPRLIDHLNEKGPGRVRTVKASGETVALMEIFSEYSSVILIDAMAMQTKPGTIHRFDAGASPLPADLFSNYSTHSMGVAEAIEMARALGELPQKIIVYGIEGIHFEPGDSMHPEVTRKMEELEKQVTLEITALKSNPNGGPLCTNTPS